MADQGNAIFQGIPPKESRNALAGLLKEGNFKKVIVPCAGRFAATETLLKTGKVSPEQIWASDISLFTSILGYKYAGKNVAELGVQIKDPKLSFLPQVEIGSNAHLAQVLYVIKYAQLCAKDIFYMTEIRDDFLRNWKHHVSFIEKELEKHEPILKGIHYEIRDLMVVLNEHKDDPEALIYINPPAYKGGYTRMFKNETITWNEPAIGEFDPKAYTAMLQMLATCAATVVVYRYQNLDNVPAGWTPFFARKYTSKRTDFLVTNKPVKNCVVCRKKDFLKKPKFPIYNDEDITKNTKVQFYLAGREEAAYIRNLFLKKLAGKTSSDINLLWKLDGRIVGAVGLQTGQAFGVGSAVKVSDNTYVHETYGITIHSKKYPRINRLLMRLLTSQDFVNELKHHINLGTIDVKGLKTVCLARFPEVRLNNGILKIVAREKLKNGLYKIEYYSDFKPKTFKANIIEFLDEEAKLRRIKDERTSDAE